jgi:GNAT superfamily N-acetyltransferase
MLRDNPTRLKEGFTARPPTLEDAPAVASLIEVCDLEVTGESDVTLDEILTDLNMPGLNRETDMRVIAAPDGRLVGYATVFDIFRPVTPFIDVYVHPDYWGDTLDAYLMNWGEERSRQVVSKVPADARIAMHANIYSQDVYYRSVLEKAGMHVIRHNYRMMIDLDQPTPPPEWPEGITLCVFQPGDDKRPVLEAQRAAFQDHWGYVEQPFEQHYAHWSHAWDEHFDPSLWFLAMDGEQIAGICLCRPRRGDDESFGWVGTLGVTRPYRRLGVGMALLLHAFGEFRARGKARVGLGVDASSLTGATRLYEKAGMHIAERFDLYEKELRPGKDYGTQSVE